MTRESKSIYTVHNEPNNGTFRFYRQNFTPTWILQSTGSQFFINFRAPVDKINVNFAYLEHSF